MSKTILERYPSASPTDRTDNYRQDLEDRSRRLLGVGAALILTLMVLTTYHWGNELMASITLAMICFNLVVWSAWILDKGPVVLRAKDGQRYALHSRHDTERYAMWFFVRVVALATLAVLVLSSKGDNTLFTITFAVGITCCALAERYRLSRARLD